MHSPGVVISAGINKVVYAASLLACSLVLSSCSSNARAATQATPTPTLQDSGQLTVQVYDSQSFASINHVTIRVTNSTTSDGVDNRELRFADCPDGQFLVVSAPDYETSFTACNGSNVYYVGLTPLHVSDDVNYEWNSAGTCVRCHAGQLGAGYNEVAEWETSAHARVFVDRYFESMYRGTNLSGQGMIGPGFKLDYPDQAGTCAYCHAPSTVQSPGLQTDLSPFFPRSEGVDGEGITCDICHKVRSVAFNNRDFPPPNQPGILSLQFLRPSSAFVTGPFSQIIVPSRDLSTKHASSTCAPILSRSEFCAACHYFKFNDMVIYNSYGEWLTSNYGKDSSSVEYKTCQDCHMSHMDVKNVSTPLSLRSACSETTDLYQNFSHNLMNVTRDETSGRDIPRLIQDAARLHVKLTYQPEKENSLRVRVEVENTRAGHKFPTDSPLRHLILVVTVTDDFGAPLQHLHGEDLPDWVGDPNASQAGVPGYAKLPGTVFANLLGGTGDDPLPMAAYWTKTNDGQFLDNRLEPGEPQVSTHAFAVPDLGNVNVSVKLIYRYAFFDLMAQKNWYRPDIEVTRTECQISPQQGRDLECK